MNEKRFPSPDVIALLREPARGPRCAGECGTPPKTGCLTCDTCWLHLPRRLRFHLRAWRRLDTAARENTLIEVEETCRAARRGIQ